MFNPKYIIWVALVGFALSFIAGLFASASFGMLLLRACCCAAAFILLYFIISLLAKKFLIPEDTLTFSESEVGKNINVVLGEETNLHDDGNNLNFTVRQYESPKNVSSVARKENIEKKVENISSASASNNDDGFEKLDSLEMDNTSTDLPDIGSLVSGFKKPNADDVDQKSFDLKDSGQQMSSGVSSDSDKSLVDADSMAKAIRTMLARDE